MGDVDVTAGMLGGKAKAEETKHVDVYDFLCSMDPASFTPGNWEPAYAQYQAAGGAIGLEEFEQIADGMFPA